MISFKCCSNKSLIRGIAFALMAALSCSQAAESGVELGLAARFVGDEGIAADADVIFATSFESGIQAPLQIKRKGVGICTNNAMAFGGKACAQITATRDVDEGGDIGLHWPDGVDACYMRVYVRFDRETAMPHHFINMSAMSDTYKYRWGGAAGLKPDGGRDGKVGTTLEPPKGEDGKWKFYTYWHEMRSWQTPEGRADGRPNAYYGNNFSMKESPPLVRDQWICVEMMLKLNTVGQCDGEQAFWIDGRKIGHWKKWEPSGTWIRDSFATFGAFNKKPQPFEGFNWRTAESLKINRVTLQWYLSSDQTWKNMTAERNTVYFDNLVVAKSYIGPMAKASGAAAP